MRSNNDASKNLTTLSKRLSWLLRHVADKKGVDLSVDGYADCNEILKLNDFRNYTIDDIIQVVNNCEKQRFSIKRDLIGTIYIRANQGHSNRLIEKTNIDVEKLLKRIDNPQDYKDVLHGTTYKALDDIMKSGGLKKMCRSHVHFTTSADLNKVVSGVRSDCEVLIYIDIAKAINDGLKFYISDNGVVLCEGIGNEGFIHSKYFTKIVDKQTNKNIDLKF